MGTFRTKASGLILTVTTIVGGWAAAPASADDIALNGTYIATSDGQWAKTNDSYHDEMSVTSTWTITSTCTSYLDCTGKVVSDQGWTADAHYLSQVWEVAHTVEGWEQCADGTSAPGDQHFTFWVDHINSSTLVGWDRTVGPSGACGKNRWLTVQMPFTLTPRQ